MSIKIKDPIFLDLLSGKTIISSCSIQFPFDLKVKNRDSILQEIVKNKKIIHVGCVDHMDILESKITSNTWLHQLLISSAQRCLGIDNNMEGIAYLQEKHKLKDLIAADLIKDQVVEILENEWDYLLLPEVIEHIPDAVLFLSSIREQYMKTINRVIITVPNLFAFSLFQNASKNIEVINTDHRHWFSPYTLLKILKDAGYTVEEFYLINGFWGPFYCNVRERISNRIMKGIGRQRGYKKIRDMRYAKGLLVIAR